jgi:hypothetical protein
MIMFLFQFFVKISFCCGVVKNQLIEHLQTTGELDKNIVFICKGIICEPRNLWRVAGVSLHHLVNLVLFNTVSTMTWISLRLDSNVPFYASINWVVLFCLQYYEMSYGLNVEMHKQVRTAHCISILQALLGQRILSRRCGTDPPCPWFSVFTRLEATFTILTTRPPLVCKWG